MSATVAPLASFRASSATSGSSSIVALGALEPSRALIAHHRREPAAADRVDAGRLRGDGDRAGQRERRRRRRRAAAETEWRSVSTYDIEYQHNDRTDADPFAPLETHDLGAAAARGARLLAGRTGHRRPAAGGAAHLAAEEVPPEDRRRPRRRPQGAAPRDARRRCPTSSPPAR